MEDYVHNKKVDERVRRKESVRECVPVESTKKAHLRTGPPP